MGDTDEKVELEEIKARLEKLIKAIIEEVRKEENDDNKYCA